jgi:membrane protein DedA with SNARE-associated domain
VIKWVKILFWVILLALGLFLGWLFTSENTLPVSIILFGKTLPEYNLGMWILITLFIGSFLGLFLSYLPALWGRQTSASKDRKIRQLEKEIDQLRATSLKG